MDILKNEHGFSILETLTAMVVLGLFMVLSTMIIKGLFVSPKSIIKNEALILASSEMDKTIYQNLTSDTCYFSDAGNLLVSRNITEADSLKSITISIIFNQNKEEILKLHALKCQ